MKKGAARLRYRRCQQPTRFPGDECLVMLQLHPVGSRKVGRASSLLGRGRAWQWNDGLGRGGLTVGCGGAGWGAECAVEGEKKAAAAQ